MKSGGGILITFEGTEGAGKSTLMREVARQLMENGALPSDRVVLTREPGGTPLAEKIRSLILSDAMDPWTELFLYEAARAEHLAQTVRPALAEGKIVLCDRFTDSTLAYQGEARGLPWKKIETTNRLATQGLRPDLTVWLDIDPAQGLQRAQEQTRFEEEGAEFQKKVRQGFKRARAQDPKRWLVLPAGQASPEALAERVIRRLRPLLERKRPARKKGPTPTKKRTKPHGRR